MTNHRFRLVISDIDGTLLNDEGFIPEENKLAVRGLKERGIGFTLATGRMDRMIRTFVRQLGVELPVIACNGAIIRDCTGDRILWQHNLPTSDALALLGHLSDLGCDYLCYTPDLVYYPAHSGRIDLFRQYNRVSAGMGIAPIPLLSLEGQEDAMISKGLVKILAVPRDAVLLADIRCRISRLPGLEGVLSMTHAFDIMAAGVSKGKAMGHLAEILGIRPAEIAAVGDNDNDAAMLAAAGFGIAMANGTDEARAAARATTASDNNQAGLTEAIGMILNDN